MDYIIITILKNEGSFINKLCDAVKKQTITPCKWIIINDNSSDNSLALLTSFQKQLDWIEIITLTEKNIRGYGPRIAELRNIAYLKAMQFNFSFIGHLDADILLPTNYYETIISQFVSKNKLGVCGGYLVNIKDGEKIIEKSESYHVRDAIRVYRKECFIDIGAKVLPIWNHDGIDIMKAIYKGWESKTIDLEAIHLRPTADSQRSIKFYFRNGFEYYKVGSSFLLIMLRTFKFSAHRPFIVCGASFLLGYLKALKKNESKHIDKELIDFSNRFHKQRIIKRLSSLFHKGFSKK